MPTTLLHTIRSNRAFKISFGDKKYLDGWEWRDEFMNEKGGVQLLRSKNQPWKNRMLETRGFHRFLTHPEVASQKEIGCLKRNIYLDSRMRCVKVSSPHSAALFRCRYFQGCISSAHDNSEWVPETAVCHQVPHTGWLKTTQVHFLTVIEARSPKSRCQQVCASSETGGEDPSLFLLASSGPRCFQLVTA